MRELPRVGDEVGGYRIESLLSRGGMAVVYVADHLRLERKVALKVLASELADDETFRERFIRESLAAAALDHQNVVPIYDAGEADGLLFIAMRRVEGTDLRGLLREEGPLDVPRALSIAMQVAGALDAAHRRGLIHRDVKPANVLVVPRPSPGLADHIYLSDFGLAKQAGSTSGLTRTGQFLGTVSYVAPEQIKGKPVDGRTDIYALGCMLFECLTGQPPFRRPDDLAVIMAHLRDDPPLVEQLRADVPQGVGAVVARMLSKDPAGRHSTCSELIAELRALQPTGSGPQPVISAADRVAPTISGPAAPPAEGASAAVSAPASPSQPESPPASSVPRSRRAMALVLAVLITTGLVVAGVLALAGGPSDIYEKILLEHLPGKVRANCREEEAPPRDVQATAAQTSAVCTIAEGAIEASYTKMSTTRDTYESFFAVARRELGVDLTSGRPGPTGSCETGSGWNYWHRPRSAGGAQHAQGLGPGTPARGTREHPLVVCFRRGGSAVIQWIDPDSEIYSIAESRRAQSDLVSWWRTSAGPRGDVEEPGRGGGTGAGGG